MRNFKNTLFRLEPLVGLDHLGEEVVEGLGEGWVGEDAIREIGGGEIALHGELNHRHQFSAEDAENGDSEDGAGTGVNDCPHQPARFVHFQRPGDRRHRHRCDLYLETFCSSFVFGHTDSPEFRIGVDAPGDQATLGGSVDAIDQVALENSEVVVRNVGEGGATVDIADGEDARNVRFEASVHRDVAALIEFDSAFAGSQQVGVRGASRGDKKVRSGDGSRVAFEVADEANRVPGTGDGVWLTRMEQGDPVLFEKCGHGIADLWVFFGENAFASIDDGDVAAQSPEDLGEFERDRAGAENDQVFRRFGQIECSGGGQIRHVAQTGKIRDPWTGAGIDHDLI